MTADLTGRTQAIVLEGATSWPDGQELIGSRCRCGTWSFPPSFTCPDPVCTLREVVRAPIGRVGRLASWTIVHVPPPPPFVPADPFVPFAIAEVEFTEGLQIIGPVSAPESTELRAGMRMETVIEAYYTNVTGVQIVGWKFRPIGDGE